MKDDITYLCMTVLEEEGIIKCMEYPYYFNAHIMEACIVHGFVIVESVEARERARS